MEKLISALKACQRGECKDCPRNWLPDCDSDLYKDAAEAIEKIIDGKEKAKHIMEYAEKRMLEENEIGNEPLTRYWAAYRDGAYRVFYELFERDEGEKNG